MDLIFLLDTSNSMAGTRINQLNHAMLDVLSGIDYVSNQNSETVNVRVISFNNVAKFVIGNENGGIPIFRACETWTNLVAKGTTDTAHAIRLCKKSIENDYLSSNTEKTVVILVTDGHCDDRNEFDNAIGETRNLISTMKSKNIYFTSVGVCDYEETELKKFAGLNDIAGWKTNFVKTIHMIDDISQLNSIIENTLINA